MSINKLKNVIGFAIALGLIAYLASALWSAIFIISLPMDQDAITDWVEVETGENRFGGTQTELEPTGFKNTLEELKYYHNVRMQDRNRYWVYGQLTIGGMVGVFVFYVIPKWRNTLEITPNATEIAIGSFFLEVFVVVVVPLVFRWALPAPITWFPQEIVDIKEMREDEALMHLRGLARE